jgi:hypothetical protein
MNSPARHPCKSLVVIDKSFKCRAAMLVAAVFLAAPVAAQDDITFDSMRAKMDTKGCMPKDYADYTVFTCDKEQADYYFTRPEHAAAPAVVKRFLNSDVATEIWWSFGGDQAALTKWLDQFHRMDRLAPRRWPLQAELPPPR